MDEPKECSVTALFNSVIGIRALSAYCKYLYPHPPTWNLYMFKNYTLQKQNGLTYQEVLSVPVSIVSQNLLNITLLIIRVKAGRGRGG